MYGASTNRPTSFFFRLFLGEKQFTRSSSLYFRVLHGANIAVRVAFDHHRAFQRRKQADSSWRERCRLPARGVNSLFLALTRHISASFCPLTLVIPLAGVTAYIRSPRVNVHRICAPSAKMSALVLIFAGYVPAYLFHPRKCAPCRSTDHELNCFVELSPARAVAHAEVIFGVYFLSFQASVTSHKDVWCSDCSQTTLQLLIRRHG